MRNNKNFVIVIIAIGMLLVGTVAYYMGKNSNPLQVNIDQKNLPPVNVPVIDNNPAPFAPIDNKDYGQAAPPFIDTKDYVSPPVLDNNNNNLQNTPKQ